MRCVITPHFRGRQGLQRRRSVILVALCVSRGWTDHFELSPVGRQGLNFNDGVQQERMPPLLGAQHSSAGPTAYARGLRECRAFGAIGQLSSAVELQHPFLQRILDGLVRDGFVTPLLAFALGRSMRHGGQESMSPAEQPRSATRRCRLRPSGRLARHHRADYERRARRETIRLIR